METLAEWFVGFVAAYAVVGIIFAAVFVLAGVGRVDASARGAGAGFRALIVPGVALFWPLLAHRWLGDRSPAPEVRR